MSVSQIRLGAIFVGWITSIFLLFAIVAGAAVAVVALGVDVTALTQKISRFTVLSLNFIAIFAIFSSFFIGGYVAGRMAAYAGALNGGMVVVTNVLVAVLAIVFVVTFANKLGIEIANPLMKALSSLAVGIFVVIAFALMGSILGGKYGEGYVDRLDLALGVTKPAPAMMQAAQTMKADKDVANPLLKTAQGSKQAQAKKKTNKSKTAS